MSFLRGSTNYVWCTTSVLGKGATGAVFQGVNKHNGEPVAVKTFNQMSHMRPVDVQMREFEVLQKVNHENIVKLLAIEDDQEGRGKVIVMELCTGGSLFNILDDPENTYGLPAHEFRLVLEHLSAGMKHLRDNSLVHRDLKPGNIMKFISEDGKTIYKLTDFGAARELEDNQPFVSLYGTEEYLHPDLYERAVLRKSISKTFTANIDLWSIGVTLYHVATGNLPFRPFGGRKNKETMHLITTKKASGVISGTQTTENGQIEWSRQLPAHCQLSIGLKNLVTPLLAGLLEENQQKMWSFDRFFKEVTNILSKKVLHVFYMNRTSSIEIYMNDDEPFFNLKEHIKLQTDVQPESQILIMNNQDMEEKVGTNSLVKGFPPTTELTPIFLYSVDNNNVTIGSELDLPKFPTFPNAVSVENDASLSKMGCSVGHECKRRIEMYSRMDQLMKYSVEQFIVVLRDTISKLLEKTQHLDELAGTVSEYGDAVNSLTLNNECNEDMAGIMDKLRSLKHNISGVTEPTQQIYNKFVIEELLNSEWKTAIRDKKCPCKINAVARAKHLIERLRDSWQHLLRDRATRSLTYNDEQFHALEKIKIAETGKRMKLLLVEDVKPVVAQIAECLADWYKRAQTIYLKTQILAKDVITCDDALYSIREQIYGKKEEVKLVSMSQKTEVITPLEPPILEREIHNTIRSMALCQIEINDIMSTNAQLVGGFQNHSLGKDDSNSIDHSRL
ncbi:serine/threonine-protein kinase TBK1 [Contarinia nasturtii]|uniref:serine/threonine-protein kinase TBK1 n=1 Tax=Contarinia nasturtii TaxID=265458 RepID=UPI0012D49D25|nr:serine/threonine-protein kinase TBK1 [Contarinia nasturtii]